MRGVWGELERGYSGVRALRRARSARLQKSSSYTSTSCFAMISSCHVSMSFVGSPTQKIVEPEPESITACASQAETSPIPARSRSDLGPILRLEAKLAQIVAQLAQRGHHLERRRLQVVDERGGVHVRVELA